MKTRINFCLILLVLPLLFLCLPHFSNAAEPVSLENVPPEKMDSLLASLSDEQVRSLLITELAKEAENNPDVRQGGGLIYQAAGLLNMLKDDPEANNTPGFFTSLRQLPVDFIHAVKSIGNGSIGHFFVVIALLFLLFGMAFLVEFFVHRFTADFKKQFQEKAIPELDGPMRFIAGIMRSIPSFINIMVFAGAVMLFYSLLPLGNPSQQYLFLTILLTLLFYRSCKELSQILCSPELPKLRVIPADDKTARVIHTSIVFLCSYVFNAVFFLALIKNLEFSRGSISIFAMGFAVMLILLIIIGILRSRNAVRDRILHQSDLNHTRNWIVEQFAQFWHVPTILYFVIIGTIMVSDQLAGVQRGNSAFLMSLLVLPLFVIFDSVGQWVIRASINSLNLTTPIPEDEQDEHLLQQHEDSLIRERKISVTAGRILKLAILGALFVWVLSLWGYHIPYATQITGAIFESLITMALGLTAWRFASSYIEKKIAEATPEEEEKEEGDDEFGNTAQRGRSYTLLPMLRKFIATTLIVMVTLIILSSFGVNIGPLLAGAGVIGLAVGFGAQKLVSDVFSGFFYLFDDAFRVGEYIQAGNVSGAVESITLRNVMLRHHRGMLQIVPHSDLGSITNFMRGGIIVKFNLEFPYDTDVDKVRKIIKKVGKAMLEDEEFGKDFINPVKSAGVREITGSVMVIRVKFKAQPGTHFVIRREAYRRITEALAAKGIHYAHKKVIVELPKDETTSLTEEQKKVALAGAAAEQLQLEEEQKQKDEGKKDGGGGMPGM